MSSPSPPPPQSSTAADIGRALLARCGFSGGNSALVEGSANPFVSNRCVKRSASTAEPTRKKQKLQPETYLSDLVDGGKPDRSDSDNQSDDESSERAADSDDDDFFDMQCATKDSLSKEYLDSPRMQWVIAAENLAEHLRSEPLLPLKDKHTDCVVTDLDSGMCLPRWHCAFLGCRACSDNAKENHVAQEKGVWHHIWTNESHKK